MYVCLLITLTRSPKAELRRAQLIGIGRMHMKGAPKPYEADPIHPLSSTPR